MNKSKGLYQLKNRFIMLVVGSMLSVCCFGGCGKEVQESAEPWEEIMVEESVEEETIEESEEQFEQLVEDSVEEPMAKIEEGVAETMEERLTNLGLQGICVVVWNESNGTEYIIEDGDAYEKQDGDRFFVCTPSEMIRIASNVPELGDSTENYCEIFFGELVENKNIEMQISCKNGEGSNIQFCMVAHQVESGSDWAKSLGYEEPKIVVWNDTTGLRKELEEGETYQLSKDDQVAMYTPESYMYDTSNAEQGNVVAGEKITVLRWNLLDLGDKFDFEISAVHIENYDTVTLHVTLLPPAE